MKKRAGKIFAWSVTALGAGIGYGYILTATGWGIPCLFRSITGFLCPGCGVTHMCISLMRGDFAGAMDSNPMLFVLSPFLLCIFGEYIFRYIKTGEKRLRKWENAALYVAIVLLALFGIVRNFP